MKAVNYGYYNSRYRMQVVSSLESATSKGRRVTPESWERAYRVSTSSSPAHPSVLMAWGGYLIRRGKPGLDKVLKQLKQTAAHYPETWLLDAVASRNDRKRSLESFSKAVGLGGRTKKAVAIGRVLGLEIKEQ